METYAYGFPRIGKNREYKTSIEKFWKGKLTREELVRGLGEIEARRQSIYAGYVDKFPAGETSYYDPMLDMACILGVYKPKDLGEYYEFARGKKALVMKKFFNTNYHYLVPMIGKNTRFRLSWDSFSESVNRIFSDKKKPLHLIGPYTFLCLSKYERDFTELFDELVIIYEKLFDLLKKQGFSLVQIDEPAFCLDVPAGHIKLIRRAYEAMAGRGLDINLVTYYGSVDFLDKLYSLPVSGIGLDFVAGRDNLENLAKKRFPADKKLICGIVDGRSVRRSDIKDRVRLIKKIKKIAGVREENLLISNSAPLSHLPLTLEAETGLSEKVKGMLSFATERLYELKLVKEYLSGKTTAAEKWSKAVSGKTVKQGALEFSTQTWSGREIISRQKIQKQSLGLPLFPTTTIGSFPQDIELRKKRGAFRKGEISPSGYEKFIEGKITGLLDKQRELGIDVAVHGEFERTDMVEFFAQKLDGCVTTSRGWVISYGTRVYRPPIIFDKVRRTKPLTVKETVFAQEHTDSLVKGIFTGPITILSWSYNLRVEPAYKVAFELAGALNKEARDLISKGIKIIQIDEPAIKEYAPLKKRDKKNYYPWAVRAFNLTSELPAGIQVHTHMCYSEFGEIMEWINRMNFDVITIETAREKGAVLDAFKKGKFNRAIGPGLWDIHSKLPAELRTIKEILDKSIAMFGPGKIWVNPDCGLKTRGWEETEISLKRLVKISREYRGKFSGKSK